MLEQQCELLVAFKPQIYRVHGCLDGCLRPLGHELKLDFFPGVNVSIAKLLLEEKLVFIVTLPERYRSPIQADGPFFQQTSSCSLSARPATLFAVAS